jgi:hypothetical protein
MMQRSTQIDWSTDWNAVLDVLVILFLTVASFPAKWPAIFQRLALNPAAVAISPFV